MTTETVIIYTDGACQPNPGRGGWGVTLTYKGADRELSGGEPDTTNNRMEMMAVIQALETLKRPCSVCLHTDSKYVIEGITKWVVGWKKRGWARKGGHPVKNEDLWRRLDNAAQRHKIEWKWVKGHSGISGNERADALANLAVMRKFENE
ncbi:MAG: ribonuclease HI [Methylobacter sp.]